MKQIFALFFMVLLVSGCAIATGGYVEGSGNASGGRICLPMPGTTCHQEQNGETVSVKTPKPSQDATTIERYPTIKPSQDATTIERYPTIECIDEVNVGQKFVVQVSLTKDLVTPQISTIPSPETKTNNGQIVIPLPKEQGTWKIKAVLSAPAFNFDNSDTTIITLPRHGDSDVALFYLIAKPIQKQKQVQKIRATLWHEGTYLAKIVREITVVNESKISGKPNKRTRKITKTTKTTQQIEIGFDLQSPNMTIMLEHKNSTIHIYSNELMPLADSLPKVVGLSKWLDGQYDEFNRASQTIIYLESFGQTTHLEKRQNIALLKGFGRKLYNQFAPPKFKKAFWALKDKLGDEFNTIHIFTDDPLIPWELMIPNRGHEELDFLGIDFQIARWHLSENPKQLERPLQFLNLQQLLAIVPEYPDDDLNAVSNELEVLQKMTGFRRVAGDYDAVSQLFQKAETDNSIIHFSGHGIVQKITPSLAKYAIKLEDRQLDVMTWQGLIPPHRQTHPFFFFNACDIGQAHQVANFVDGWAPAVLEAGASGYIGGLWPLVNKGATEFAELFYQQLEKNLNAGQPANVADLLRKTRKLFYDNGDPTFLGYVYYGEPHFQLVRES